MGYLGCHLQHGVPEVKSDVVYTAGMFTCTVCNRRSAGERLTLYFYAPTNHERPNRKALVCQTCVEVIAAESKSNRLVDVQQPQQHPGHDGDTQASDQCCGRVGSSTAGRDRAGEEHDERYAGHDDPQRLP